MYQLFDLNFKLDLVEFHSNLGKLFNGRQESSARLIFKAITTVRIEDLKAHFSPAGIKIDTGRIEASTRLFLSRISITKGAVTYISKLIDLDISSEKRFDIKNLFLSSGIIDTLILLVEHPHSDRKRIHSVNDPLLINNEYGLVIKVVGAYRDFFENLEKKVIELEEGFKVSVTGEAEKLNL